MLDRKVNITNRPDAPRPTLLIQIDPSFCIEELINQPIDVCGNYPWYALTINPKTVDYDDEITRGNSFKNSFKSMYSEYPTSEPSEIYNHVHSHFKKYNGLMDYFLFPEFSKTGRFHFHGCIRIKHDSLVHFFFKFMPALIKLGAISIEHINDMAGWITYCKKQRLVMEPFFVLPYSGLNESQKYLMNNIPESSFPQVDKPTILDVMNPTPVMPDETGENLQKNKKKKKSIRNI